MKKSFLLYWEQFFPRFYCHCFFRFFFRKYCSFLVAKLFPFDVWCIRFSTCTQSSILYAEHFLCFVSVPCRVSVSFFVVCSSMKLHWFRNFIILHKIMRLCCLLASVPRVCLALSPISSSWNTPFHPLLFIFVTMNCKAMYMKTFLLHLLFFHYILLFCFVLFLSFYFWSPFTAVLSLVLLLFLNTQQLCAVLSLSRYTKHQFILIWFCALDERTKAKTKIKAKQSAPSKRERETAYAEWN